MALIFKNRYKEEKKEYLIPKERLHELFQKKPTDKPIIREYRQNLSIEYKGDNRYEVYRTIGPFISGGGSSKLAVIEVLVEENDSTLSKVKMTAKYMGLKGLVWTLLVITGLSLCYAIWKIKTLDSIERFNLLIVPLFTGLMSWVAPKIYRHYRARLIDSFEWYLNKTVAKTGKSPKRFD
jgi:hypothetical protein